MRMLVTLLGLCLLAACGKTERKTSELSSLMTLENIDSGDGLIWAKMNLRMIDSKSDEVAFEMNIDAANAKQMPLLRAKRGSYLIKILYKDSEGNLVYKSCRDDENKVHEIHAAQYMAKIGICKVVDDSPVGDAGIVSAEEISMIAVVPEIKGEETPDRSE